MAAALTPTLPENRDNIETYIKTPIALIAMYA
jgi:hypothetical protein